MYIQLEPVHINSVLVKHACLHRIMKEIPHNQPDVIAKHINHCLNMYDKVMDMNRKAERIRIETEQQKIHDLKVNK
jgi:hypothetical protein